MTDIRRTRIIAAERALCRFLARQSDVLLAGLANRLENGCV
jgi:hypothetical protein